MWCIWHVLCPQGVMVIDNLSLCIVFVDWFFASLKIMVLEHFWPLLSCSITSLLFCLSKEPSILDKIERVLFSDSFADSVAERSLQCLKDDWMMLVGISFFSQIDLYISHKSNILKSSWYVTTVGYLLASKLIDWSKMRWSKTPFSSYLWKSCRFKY